MIRYAPRSEVGFIRFLMNVLRNSGAMSCFRFAFKIAFWATALTALVKYLDLFVWEGFLLDILPKKDVYTSLYTMVSLVVVFHTVQSYQRFMSGIGLIYQIMGDFHDVSSLLICFSKASKCPEHDKIQFQNTLVRLFSMHFMVCLAHLEDKSRSTPRMAHQYDLVDPEGIDPETLKKIIESPDKPSVVYQRILDLMMHSFNTGVIDVPAPLFTRCFQELGNGMIKFHEAMQYMEVPFPLPYMAITDMLLLVFSVLTPLFVASWTDKIAVAATFGFVPIFAMWLLHGVAEELDNPFDGDTTDIDADTLIEDFNQQLCALLGHNTLKPPAASDCAQQEIPSWHELKDMLHAGVKSLHGFIKDESKNNVNNLFEDTDNRKSVSSGGGDGDIEAPTEGLRPKADPSTPVADIGSLGSSQVVSASPVAGVGSLGSSQAVSVSKTLGLCASDGTAVLRSSDSDTLLGTSHFSSSSAARISLMLHELNSRQVSPVSTSGRTANEEFLQRETGLTKGREI